MKEKNSNDVIVIGGDHHNTLGVIRSLGEKGLRSSLILVTKEKNPFVGYSKYLEQKQYVEEATCVPDILLNDYKDGDLKPVVICCSDSTMGAVDDNRNRLSPFFILPGSEIQGRISNLMSKKEMARLATKVGLHIPHTCYGNEIEENPNFPLPCIIKPIVSRFGSKEDIHICKSYNEVREILKLGDANFLIQQFIEKEFEYQLIGCSTGTEVIIPGVSIILRPCKGSNTSFLHYIPLKDDFCEIEKCRNFVLKTGYRGLFSLEFLRDKNGIDYFMEINFRNDGNAISVTAAGVNLPYIWYLASIGCDYTEEKKHKISPVYIMPDTAEMKLLLTRQISIIQYFSDLIKTNRFMEYDRHDIKPWLKMISKKMKSLVSIKKR